MIHALSIAVSQCALGFVGINIGGSPICLSFIKYRWMSFSELVHGQLFIADTEFLKRICEPCHVTRAHFLSISSSHLELLWFVGKCRNGVLEVRAMAARRVCNLKGGVHVKVQDEEVFNWSGDVKRVSLEVNQNRKKLLLLPAFWKLVYELRQEFAVSCKFLWPIDYMRTRNVGW